MGLGSPYTEKNMSGIAKAMLAAALLNCGLLSASAEDNSTTGQWLKDGDCALYSAGAGSGDTVKWTGECVDGYAEGLGTATFTHDGQSQSFTANFTHGVIPDGHIITRWGQGWSYDGETVAGRFNGAGILITDTSDRFEGQWTDGKMNGFGILRRANGELYAGDWKDDKPNGNGELRRADGTKIDGDFVDGKLAQAKTTADAGAPAKIAAAETAPDLAQRLQRALRQRVGQDPDRCGWLFHRADPDRRRHGTAGRSRRRHRQENHLHFHDRPHGHGGGRQRQPQRRLQCHRLLPADRQGRGDPLCRRPFHHAVGQSRWRRADGDGQRLPVPPAAPGIRPGTASAMPKRKWR